MHSVCGTGALWWRVTTWNILTIPSHPHISQIHFSIPYARAETHPHSHVPNMRVWKSYRFTVAALSKDTLGWWSKIEEIQAHRLVLQKSTPQPLFSSNSQVEPQELGYKPCLPVWILAGPAALHLPPEINRCDRVVQFFFDSSITPTLSL